MARTGQLDPLFRLLAERGQSKRWFAKQVGLNRTHLYQIHWGERPLTPEFRSAVARVTQVPESLLFRVPDELRAPNDSVSDEEPIGARRTA